LTTLRTPDGETLALQDWPVAAGAGRAVVLLVHGLGEHAGRYGPLAARLNAWGFAARAGWSTTWRW
jgi:alpha-beta hydrolase superfamily lysophospholipase